MDLGAIRSDYTGNSIASLPLEPHRGIELWLEQALKTEEEATAFSLATHGDAGLSVRVVLAKKISQAGVVFYTNGLSLKGKQLDRSAVAAGVFFWPKLQRQLRFEGKVSRVAEQDADAYFASRPRESQIAAAVSRQSEPIESYEKLQADFQKAKTDFGDREIPRPPHWGGYLITLERVEFWQGQRSRLHQRLLYERGADAIYTRQWLQP
jgi:pyridoxamine 5'-phosphate oxidase